MVTETIWFSRVWYHRGLRYLHNSGINSSISRFSKLTTADQRGCLSFGFSIFFSFFFKRINVVALLGGGLLRPWDHVPEESYHHLGLSPMRPNELWTCSRDRAAMVQVHGCQRNSCGSVRRGRGGDRCNQRRS